MTAPKFTPGPWTVGKDYTIGPSGAGVAVITAACPEQLHAANAHLIAAAPDMYEALRDTAALAAALTSHTIFINGQYVEVREAVARARSALAKARGEQ